MNKILLSAMSVVIATSLSASTFATVNGIEIKDDDLRPMLQGAPIGDGFDLANLPSNIKKDLVDRAIQTKLLTKKAIDSGIENDVVYKNQLEIAKQQLAFRVYQLKEFEKITVNDKEIEEFYNRNKASFVEPEQYHVKHILVKTEKEAKDIIASFSKLSGDTLNKKFDDTAKLQSIEPAAKQTGGDLGWVDPSKVVPSFADAIKAMKKGELSKTPVKSEFGYHVIYKLDEKAQKQLTLSDSNIKAYISEILKEDKFKMELEKQAKDLQNSAKIEYKFDLNTTK